MGAPGGSSQVCCNDNNILTCVDAVVDPEALLSGENISILEKDLKFSSFIEPTGSVYKNEAGDEAVLTYNPNTKNIFGSFKTYDHKSYALEKCQDGYVWKEYEVDSFGEDVVEINSDSDDLPTFAANRTTDTTTMVNYTVMFYYTPEFASITSDIPGYIDQVIAETNQGYANSQIPVRVEKFCIEAATINDMSDTSTFLSTFANMKGSASALRNTADAAALLALSFNSCGVAFMATYTNGNTVSIAKKSCALGYFSFGHELGKGSI